MSVERLVTQLIDIMAKLRDPKSGCAWDLEQTFETIIPYTIEEAFEVADSVAAKDWPEFKEELGDLLLQVVFHARIAEEQHLFSFDDIVSTLNEKLVRRHPHVFGNQQGADIEQIKQTWEIIKADERENKGRRHVSALDGVPSGLPALQKATKLQKKAAKVGFDWSSLAPVLQQVHAEVAELERALEENDPDAIEDELGDVFFTLVNVSRHLKIDSDGALRRASVKFEARFRDMEEQARQHGQSLQDLDEDSLERLWRSAKTRLLRS
ncbi:MAG: nucleoside triphosphate pyrophosphohydrolase [Alcanivoracaceae bacterium]|nr:nucleoside triphosphate pyrophosphohydrolase [Alcanivoracaceae bacterium]